MGLVVPALAPLARAGFVPDASGKRWTYDNAARSTHWSVLWMEASDDPDETTLACRVTHDRIDGDQSIYVTLQGIDDTERANLVLVVAEIASVLDDENYDKALGPLFGSGLEVTYRDGWLKVSRAKADLDEGALARRSAFVSACRASGFSDTSGYDAMFDAGLILSPEARAEQKTARGALVLDYYAFRDFVELSFQRDDDDRTVRLRGFRPSDVRRAVEACAHLAAGTDARSLESAVRELAACCRRATIETADGWRSLDGGAPS